MKISFWPDICVCEHLRLWTIEVCGHLWTFVFRESLLLQPEERGNHREAVEVPDETAAAKLLAASYVEWNAVKGNPSVKHPKHWKWCSYATARGDRPYAGRIREGYEKLFGCGWKEARMRLEAVFSDHLPKDFGEEYLMKVMTGEKKLRMAQLIKAVSLTRLAFFSPRREFVDETYVKLGEHFPGQKYRSVDYLRIFDWPDAPRIAA